MTLRETRDYISIATTRPETMLGDGAVAVNPSDERYASLIGKLCEIPVGPKAQRRLIPIIVDEYPDPEFGSGAVKITGAHDFNDYEVARRNHIPLYRLMDVTGSMRDDGADYSQCANAAMEIVRSGVLPDENTVDEINLVPDAYRGLDRFEARKRIVADITAEGLAVTVVDGEGNAVPFVEAKKIMQPFGDRSGVVIEPMLTDQWFADTATLAGPAIASVREGRTDFVPKNWENTYFQWMENIQPWCISRQLWWGHQIPAWYGPDGTVFVEKDEEAALSAAIQHYIAHEGPWKAWVEEKLEEFKPGEILTRDPDVLDTWFSSALWPFSTLGWPDKTPELERYYPTSVLVTGFDIIFFWVARMMMMGKHFMGDEPFHTVYVQALGRAKHGAKMSKSKGNVIDPLELIGEYGADALRFTLAILAAQGRDVKLDPARIAGYRNFGTKLWNATRFAQMNGVARARDFNPASVELTLNRWMVTELARATSDITTAIEKCRFNDAAGAAYKFVWNTLCDWYLELLKPVFLGSDENAKAESQACAAHILDETFKLLHPFMPFMTEELWQATAGETPRGSLLCHAHWPVPAIADDLAADEINWLISLVTDLRSVRAEMNIKPGLMLPMVVAGADATTRARLEIHGAAITRLARVDPIALADAAPANSAQIVVGEATACLPLEGIVDLSAERTRLAKEIKRLEGEVKRLDGKLSNAKFVANAPEEVVEEEREKLSGYTAELERNRKAYERVAG